MQLSILVCFFHLIRFLQPYTKTATVLQFTSLALCSSGILRRITGRLVKTLRQSMGIPKYVQKSPIDAGK
jgi:hypothetical protein